MNVDQTIQHATIHANKRGLANLLDQIQATTILQEMNSMTLTPALRQPAFQAAYDMYSVVAGKRLLFQVRDIFIAAMILLTASVVVHADEHIQSWIPDVLTMPEDTELVADRAIGSKLRMFSISTGADVDALFIDWEESLNTNGYPVAQRDNELLDRSIEFSGPGIVNAKIIVLPASSDGQTVIEFDATLD